MGRSAPGDDGRSLARAAVTVALADDPTLPACLWGVAHWERAVAASELLAIARDAVAALEVVCPGWWRDYAMAVAVQPAA